uniref:Uncharacterized protein n=1 Tax=Oryctolagus cuniculus TaxID=9986 RepID=A0A5F9D5Y1_RABIT
MPQVQIPVHRASLLPDAGGSAELADPGLQLCVLQLHWGLHGPHQPGGHLLLPVRGRLQRLR